MFPSSLLPLPPTMPAMVLTTACFLPQLFCQNLSLFAKLFLENKSVCFDLSAFNYYILVLHTQDNGVRQRSSSRMSDDGTGLLQGNRAYQVIGFFSKEKMSWDSNNVACILVFPPWQRKGLGKILMGVSYELSRREGRVGGPEKRRSALPSLHQPEADSEGSPLDARKAGLPLLLVRHDSPIYPLVPGKAEHQRPEHLREYLHPPCRRHRRLEGHGCPLSSPARQDLGIVVLVLVPARKGRHEV